MAEGLTAFRWGARDCGTAAAAHVRRLTGRDVYAPFAGRYASAREAARMLREGGGLLAVVDAALAGVWARGGAELAALGDARAPVLAVRRGAYWAAPTEAGEVLVRADLVAPLATWGPA